MTYLIVVQAQLLHRDQVLERAPFDGVNLIVGQQSANEEAILV